jgi:hypothetical protein
LIEPIFPKFTLEKWLRDPKLGTPEQRARWREAVNLYAATETETPEELQTFQQKRKTSPPVKAAGVRQSSFEVLMV